MNVMTACDKCTTPRNCTMARRCVGIQLQNAQRQIDWEHQRLAGMQNFNPAEAAKEVVELQKRMHEEQGSTLDRLVPRSREIYPTDERELRTKALLDKAKLTPGERMELTMLLNHKWAKPNAR